MSDILHGGRLHKVRQDVAQFTSSIKHDSRLLDAVIAINKAHVVMLIEQKIIKRSDGEKILQALNNVSKMQLDPSAEDVHMFVEEAVLKEVGLEVGGNLHIAKSRNDQVATAIRMALREELISLMRSLAHFQEHLAETAEEHLESVILEYTHLQPAQPVTFAHYLLSYFDALTRDFQRIKEAFERVNQSPLGSCALATTSFPINRDRTSDLLGFNNIVENSLDAVGSRDFIIETISALNLTAVNLSRLAEDLIIWSTPDFGVIELPDEFTSTSSIMPQKKNAEILEVIRARASDVLGNLMASVATVKNLPTTYNLDFQEITPKLWESIEIVKTSLDMLHKLLPKITVIGNVTKKAAEGFVGATELANVLVRKYDVSFRSAHKIVGALVKSLGDSKLTFNEATPELLKRVAKESSGIELSVKKEDISYLFDPLKLVKANNVKGGPSPDVVKKAIEARMKLVFRTKSNISDVDKEVGEAENRLETAVKSFLPSN